MFGANHKSLQDPKCIQGLDNEWIQGSFWLMQETIPANIDEFLT